MTGWKEERFKFARSMPWTAWYAWYPVKTISGRWIWRTTVYRKKGNNYVDNEDWAWYFYGDDFDVLRTV